MSVNKVNKTTGDLSLLAGGTLFADNPIGSIIPYGGATAPAGWFICDGTELVKVTYPELFAVIGTSFGTPSDNTKFKLPDLREATTKGVGLTGKSNNHMDADGLALGEFIDDRLQDHEQKLVNKNNQELRDYAGLLSQGGTGVGILSNDEEYASIKAATFLTGRHGATTEVKAVGVNYIIKAASVGVPADFMSAVEGAIDLAIESLETIVHISQLPSGSPSNFDKCDFTYIKRGRIVTIQGYIHATDAESGKIYFNLPAIKSNDIAPLASVNTTTGSLLDCEVEGNYLYLQTLSAGNCRFSGTYITES